jgi:hypothetical protein
MRKYLFFAFTALCGWSCHLPSRPAAKRLNKITNLIFTSGGCNGKCPQFVMGIESSLNVNFYGERYTDKSGFYTGKVTEGFWDSLNIRFERLKFERLDSSYEFSQDDLDVAISAWYGIRKKTVQGQFDDLPDSVQTTVNWLLEVYEHISLAPAQDTGYFYERFRRPPILPPIMEPPKVVERPQSPKRLHFISAFGDFSMLAPNSWKYIKVEGLGSFDGRIDMGQHDTLDFSLGFWVSHLSKGQLQSVSDDELYVPAMTYPYKIDGYCVAYQEMPRDTGMSVTRVYIDSIYSMGPMVVKFDFHGSHLSEAHEALFYQVARTIKFGERMHAQLTPEFR